MLLRARIVLPISSAPIENGAVRIEGNRIAEVGRWKDFSSASSAAVDLGEVILLPGLINAHCHLDYTEMSGQPPPRQFPDWIKGLLARKSGVTYAEYAQGWLRGAAMLLRNGVTTVADIEAVPELLPEVWSSTPLRVGSFIEMTGVISKRPPETIVDDAAQKIDSLPLRHCFAGMSPHAIYSTTPALLRASADRARRRNWRVTTHVAESIEEFEMCRHARGPLFDWLKNQRDMSDCGGATPMELIRRAGLLGENFLAVHANYLEPDDIVALKESGSSVVHCPRSHAYFRHRTFPSQELETAGVNVCLGTDSLASVAPEPKTGPELSMFAEMQIFAAANSGIAPGKILEMATVNGARALGLLGKIGELASESYADLITLSYSGPVTGAATSVVNHGGEVRSALIGGCWVKQ